MSNILVTTDFSDESKRAFAPATALAKQLGVGITLVTVVEDLKAIPHGSPLAPPQSSPELASEVAEAETRLAKLTGEFAGASVETHVATGESIAKTIARTAEDLGAQFIAISSHGHTGIRAMVLGSVAEETIRHSKVPVICYPPDK